MTKAMPFLQKVILLSYDPRPLRKEPSMDKHGRLFCVEDVKGGKNYLTKLLAKVCTRLQK